MTMKNHARGASSAALRESAAHLLERLRERLGRRDDPPGTLVRVDIRVGALDLLNWLHAQSGQTHYYWSSRDGDFEMAGIGEADVLAPDARVDLPGLFTRMRRRLSMEWPLLHY